MTTPEMATPEEFAVRILGWLTLLALFFLAGHASNLLWQRRTKTLWTYAAMSATFCVSIVTLVPLATHWNRSRLFRSLDPYLLEPIGRFLLDGLRWIWQACSNF
jgi:hypothetical protein